MSLQIIDRIRIVYLLCTKTLSGNLIGIAGKPARGTLSNQILAGQYQAETYDRAGGFRPAATIWAAQARLTTTLLSRVRSALRLSRRVPQEQLHRDTRWRAWIELPVRWLQSILHPC